MPNNDLYMNIDKIDLAHVFTLDSTHKCEYPLGRGQYGLVFSLEGEAEYQFCTGERVTVGQSDLLLLTPHAAYSICSRAPFRHYTVNFDIHEESSTGNIFENNYCLLRVKNPDEYKKLLKKLTSLRLSKRAGSDMLALSCLYEILASVFAELGATEQDSDKYSRLIPAKEYIDQHPTEPISLEYLAHLSRMSITNFRREWSKIYSETPMQYRDRVRIFYAKEYLGSGYYTVTEVAYRCGFDDVSYFIRFFKKHTGISPKKFKESLH